jgi:transcriptional regulator, abrB family protein
MENKTCIICGETKNSDLFEEYYKLPNNKICYICKECNEEMKKRLELKQIDLNKVEEDFIYFNNYECVFSYNLNYNEPKIIKDSNEKKCRFCGKKEPEITFRKKAHAISEMLGNRTLLSDNECDECNAFFGDNLENDLGKYLGIIRTLTQIVGKGGIPSYKTKNKKARIDYTNKGLVIQNVVDDEFLTLENNSLIFKVEREPYTPINVYKSFVKMAMSLIPEDLLFNFDDTLKWLKEEPNIESKYNMDDYAYIIEKFIPGPKPHNLNVRGFIRKNDKIRLPYFIFLVEFGNYSFQIIIPCIKKDFMLANSKVTLKSFPNIYDILGNPFGKSTINFKNMQGKEVVRNEKIEFKLYFEKFQELEINGKTQEELFEEQGINLNKSLKPKEKK